MARGNDHAPEQHRQKSGDHRVSSGFSHEQGGLRADDDTAAPIDPSTVIKFGSTKFSDYSKVQTLGRGTYGEVTRCIHIASNIEVAMKTFFFDVSAGKDLVKAFFTKVNESLIF